MRILLFAPAFAPFANPEAIVNSKLALAFLEAGWEVEVVTRDLAAESAYNYGSGWVEPWLPLRERAHTVRYPAAGGLGKAADTLRGALAVGAFVPGCRWAAHAVALARTLARGRGFDAVISRSGPEAAHLAALAFVRGEGMPWVANWNDPSAEKMPPPCGQGQEGRRRPREDRFRARVAAAASWHTFPAERLRAYMTRYLGPRAAARSSVVPHVALPGGGAAGRRDPGRFVLCHAGSFAHGRDAGPLLRGFARFLREEGARDEARLLLVGGAPGALAGQIGAAGLEGVVEERGPLGYLETLTVVAASDVAVLVEAPCAEGIFLPSKVVDYAAAGRPILALSPAAGTMADLFAAHGGGLRVGAAGEEEIARAVGALHRDWREGRLEERHGSRTLGKLFAPGTVVAAWREILERAAGRAA
jgi:hypothetical protein